MRHFKTEDESLEFFKEELKERGFSNIVNTQSINSFLYYDIEASKEGKIYRFECKNRDLKSTDYNDAVIEGQKYQSFIEHKDEYDFCILVTFFEDCYTLSDIKKWYKISNKYASKTTDFNDGRIVKKTFVHYHQHKKYNYEKQNFK